MRVAKVYVKGKPKFYEVIDTPIRPKFDGRMGWVFVRDCGTAIHFAEEKWIHPDDTPFEWVRVFSWKEDYSLDK